MPQHNQPKHGSLKRNPFGELMSPNQLPPRNKFNATKGNATQPITGSLKKPTGGKRRKRTRKRTRKSRR